MLREEAAPSLSEDRMRHPSVQRRENSWTTGSVAELKTALLTRAVAALALETPALLLSRFIMLLEEGAAEIS